MKTMPKFLFVLSFIFFSLLLYAQKDFPELDVEYNSVISTYEDEGQTVYTFKFESTTSEVLAIYNLQLKEESDAYDIIKELPAAIIIEPFETITFFKCKGSTRPGATWNHKFLRYEEDYSSYPVKGKDYFFHYSSKTEGDFITYTYYFMNISEEDIKFYNFTLSDDVDFFTNKDLPESSVIVSSGDNFMVVEFWMSASNDSPLLNWNADWPGGGSDVEKNIGNPDIHTTNYDFCEGVLALLSSSKHKFDDMIGAKNEGGLIFDSYESGIHLEGVNDEVIDDLIIFLQYFGNIGYSGSLSVIENRFYEYKLRLGSCVPSALEAKLYTEDDEDNDYLKVVYSGYWNGDDHTVTLQIVEDYGNDGYYNLQFSVDEILDF